MQNLPIELNYEIGNYLFTCKKNPLYINKEFTDIFTHVTKNCKPHKISGKTYCQNCEKDKIWKSRMITKNLLTG